MQHRTPIAAILSALTALKNGGAALLKKPGGALRAFIGAGFCVVILSLSACASKGAAGISTSGIVNVGGGGNPDPTTPSPVSIETSDSLIIEGGAVMLTITSDRAVPTALTGGLTVIIDIVGANAADFESSESCPTPPQCVVVIPSGQTAATLTIMALIDADDTAEEWTAAIVIPPNEDFAADPDNANANFIISKTDILPAVANNPNLMLFALNRYTVPTALSVDEIREGEDSADVGDITGFQYNDADGNPRVLVERLRFAHLGIGINGNIDDANFDFAHLNENVATPPTTLGDATYTLEGEMTYNGNRFYPDGELVADFLNTRVTGAISLDGQEAADDFGGTTFADGTTPITNGDNLTLGLNAAVILGNAFSGTGNLAIITAEGFFTPLSGRPAGDYSGRFNDAASYNMATATPTAAPLEVSGIFGGITDASSNELKGGFLGQCSQGGCGLPIIGVSSSTGTAQEGGDVVLMITSNIPAPATGLAVDINIGGIGVMADEFTATGPVTCTNLVCTVTIPATMRMVLLTLTPTADFSTEGTEEWTASLVGGGGNYNLDASASNRNVVFDIDDAIADIGIMPLPPGTTATEGGAIALTITSNINAPTDGLLVTIDISDVDMEVSDDDISSTSTECRGLVCIVRIPMGENFVVLNLMPATGDESENPEDWTARIRPDSDPARFNTPAATDEAMFTINNFPLPARENNLMLSELDAYDLPTRLVANQIRDGGDAPAIITAIGGITGFRYNNPSNLPEVYVQMLEFAHLGIWVNEQEPTVISLSTATVSDFNNDFLYAFLGDNAIPASDLPDSGMAGYSIEGDATYKGVNFFPDGFMTADFNRGSFEFAISALGDSASEDFGDANAMVPDGGGIQPVAMQDRIEIEIAGTLNGNEIQGTPTITNAAGFFADLSSFTSASFSARFYDSPTYDSTTFPLELSGVMDITDIGDDLHMGFLGRRTP